MHLEWWSLPSLGSNFWGYFTLASNFKCHKIYQFQLSGNGEVFLYIYLLKSCFSICDLKLAIGLFAPSNSNSKSGKDSNSNYFSTATAKFKG